MKRNESLPLDYLEALFEYRDGELYWKVKKKKNSNIGDKAGSKSIDYCHIKIDGTYYKTHRVIYQLLNGLEQLDPAIVVDHIDHDSFNNRIENLRAASGSSNQWNKKLNKNNKLQEKDICVVTRKTTKRTITYYQLRIKRGGEVAVLKIYNAEKYSLEEVKVFRDEFLRQLHGEFAYDGNKAVVEPNRPS